MADTTNIKTSDNEFVSTVVVRISRSDKEILDRISNATGKPVSEVIRTLIRANENANIADSLGMDTSHKALLAAQNVRTVFKKISSQFNDVVADYRNHVKGGNEYFIRRDISGLNELMLNVQKALNIYLSDYRVGAVNTVARMVTTPEPQTSAPASNISELNPKLRCMIKTFMTGFVVDEPRTFTTKDGTDMYSFKIQVQNMDGNPDRFEVVAKKDDEVFPLVRKDAHVSVAGDLVKHAYEKEGKKYTIYQVKFPTITF